ncbi:GPW/gp25 family protein [Flammeovirga aprica]|uniref:GPW/gp25 family protein n=1 Tax=Flammeovirga aprica JL-4 TaxID=694437 RepID=A0A7X9RWZ4_9BACT|nr:GPW/gp25 family protein [Flammeovirga aprica]NME70277.1 GPW/gp25 family protein [Flammeovirga aprica JL-4]
MKNYTGWKFPPSFNDKGTEIEMVSDHIDIRESLYILFSTHPGERPVNINYGCNLRQFLFKRLNSQLVLDIKYTINEAIQKFEDRIKVLDITIDEEDELNGKFLSIYILYQIKETGETGEFNYQSEAQ